ncbi:hypothetical protein [Mesobacillus selenatarsenatis]|uniref:Phage protein n=1 Tax=Mesobacillus selenatarsenatis (strain DSM 18680 / JCM 14380 / FERM P-15431 / SF-1) TaxID=1321606 RepID=A0A0A8XC18_MESS1|nr:hypothetical protein [Mesobacillus selenatarsenatis]GAM15721.1 hypothetical protein SAMD00020551_3879 [Mesobacillus selenatarsenatis SF-1]
MDNLELKIKELEMKIEELESQQENFQETVQSQLDNNDVRTLMEQMLDEKDFVTAPDMEQSLSKSQVQLIKWIVGTGISSISIIIALFEFLK